MRYHFNFTATRMVIIKRLTITSVGDDAKKLESSCIADENVKCGSHFGQLFVSSSKS